MSILLALLGFLLQSAAAPAQIQVGTVVRPETTTVGQHFRAIVRIRVPVGTDIRFPLRPDSGASVDSAGAATRTDSTANGYTESTMSYVLAAWDTGTQGLGIDSVTTVTNGVERIAVLPRFNVYVRSVLPLDSALRKPKPFRPIIEASPFNWLPWAVAAAVLALIAIVVFAWRRWERKRGMGFTPLQIAQREFARIDTQRLVESGETERYVIEMTGVMRRYLVSVIPAIAASATTRELSAALARTNRVPGQRLLAILDETDLVKFARGRVTTGRAVEIGAEARSIVDETAAAQAAAAAAAAHTEDKDRGALDAPPRKAA